MVYWILDNGGNMIKIYNEDCMDTMRGIDSETIQLTMTSPPYFNLKSYADGFSKWDTYEKYIESNKEWFNELFRITKKGGYIVWNIVENIPNPIKGERLDYPLLLDILNIGTKLGLVWETNVIWNKQNSNLYFGSYPKPGTPIFLHRNEHIIIFRKRGKYSGDKKERSDFKLEKNRWFEIVRNVWDIAPASAKKRGHDAPFPHEIPRRFIEIMTVPSDIVFEPFAGSGTVLEVCKELNRNCIGAEISKKYCDMIIDRIKDD